MTSTMLMRLAGRAAGAAFAVLLAGTAAAAVPANPCKAPAIPEAVKSAADKTALLAKVDAYKTCIQKYYNERKAAADANARAANAAREAYNAVVEKVNALGN